MNSFDEILQKRNTPGVLIFDLKEQLLYCNQEALTLIPELHEPGSSAYTEGVGLDISSLCKQIMTAGKVNSTLLYRSEDVVLAMRGFLIRSTQENSNLPEHIMLLVEGIIEAHKIDFEMAQRKYMISTRELEVLRLLCQGLFNKGIAEKLFISEYTVKDHIKKIMGKMNASTRSEIISMLK